MFTDGSEVSRGRTCGSGALYGFLKQPEDGINSQSGKAQAHEVGGRAAEDQKQIRTRINHTGSLHMKCYSRD